MLIIPNKGTEENGTMGLFDKKFCDVCGNKIGLLGNKKLEDGNLCKECEAKLSPWFSERRSSTLEEIKAQLQYREENRAAAAAFQTTRAYGRNCKLLLDENARKFTVTSATNLAEANPDILDYSQVTGCDFSVKENRTEMKRKDNEGHMVSYNPPRYEYAYDFYITISVNNPYFDDMRFRLNPASVKTGERSMGGTVIVKPGMMGAAPGAAEYQEYVKLGNEIKQAVEGLRQGVRDQIDAANAPRPTVTCPFCGAVTKPGPDGCCEYCGAKVID